MGESRKAFIACSKDTSITQDPAIVCILKPCLVTIFPALLNLVSFYYLRMSSKNHFNRNYKDSCLFGSDK